MVATYSHVVIKCKLVRIHENTNHCLSHTCHISSPQESRVASGYCIGWCRSGRFYQGRKYYGQGCPGGMRPGHFWGWKWSDRTTTQQPLKKVLLNPCSLPPGPSFLAWTIAVVLLGPHSVVNSPALPGLCIWFVPSQCLH